MFVGVDDCVYVGVNVGVIDGVGVFVGVNVGERDGVIVEVGVAVKVIVYVGV